MKSKTLITLAVASTFGLSAGASAGSSHEVSTPMSVNETGEVLPYGSYATMSQDASIGSNAAFDSSSTGMYSSDARDAGAIGTSDQYGALTTDELLALDEGIYSNVHTASLRPTASEDWMSYVQPVSFDALIASASGVDEASG